MANLSALGIGCSEATASGTLAVTGNWNFADGPADNDEILTDTTQTTGEIVLGLGPECLNVSGTMVSCADVAGPLASIGSSRPRVSSPPPSKAAATARVSSISRGQPDS
jgi:hypothetical protein